MSAAGAIRAGAAYVEVFMEQNALSRSLAATSAKLRSWSAGLGRLGAATRGGELPGPLAAIANFSFSPAGLITGMLTAVREWSKGGAELAHLAEQAGTTVEAFSALSYAARRTGVDTAGLATGIRKMQVTIAAAARGMPQASEALVSMGADLRELARMRPEDQLKYMADRVAAIANPTERAAAAVQIFGRSGTEMLPMLMQGSAGIDRFEKRARELGLVTSTESAQAALRFSRALADLTDVLKKCVSVIGSALGPYVEELTNWIITAAVKVRQWIADHRGLVLVLFKVAGAIVLAGAALSLFGSIIGMVATAVTGVVSFIGMIGTVISAAGTLIAGIWGGITAVVGVVDAAKKEFDAARGEAAARRAAIGKDKGGSGEGGQFAPLDLDAMPGAKASVVGTFSAAAVSGLGLGGGVFQEMKHQLTRIGDNGEKLLDEVQMGGRWD